MADHHKERVEISRIVTDSSGAKFHLYEECCEHKCLTEEDVRRIVLDALKEVGRGMAMGPGHDYLNRWFQ